MRKGIGSVLIAVVSGLLLTALAFSIASGQSSQPASKATAAVVELVALPIISADTVGGSATTDSGWRVILSQQIKTANKKDLFISPSLECGMLTKTGVKSNDLSKDIAKADAQVRIRVVVDPTTPGTLGGPGSGGTFAFPDQGLDLDSVNGGATKVAAGEGVTYCRRVQELSAKLQGALDCPSGAAIPSGCTLTDEEIELLLKTLEASTFNFVLDDLSSGTHIVEVQARAIAKVSTSSTGTNNEVANAKAFAGAGSVTVEEVRMIRNEVINF